MYESIPENENKNPETIKLEKLDFESLKDLSKEVEKLAATSFMEIDDGFENINGDKIWIQEFNGKWEIFNIADSLKNFHRHATDQFDNLQKKFDTKEELMEEIRKMIEELNCRIIE